MTVAPSVADDIVTHSTLRVQVTRAVSVPFAVQRRITLPTEELAVLVTAMLERGRSDEENGCLCGHNVAGDAPAATAAVADAPTCDGVHAIDDE